MGRLRESHGPMIPAFRPTGDMLRALFREQKGLMELYESRFPERREGSMSLSLAAAADRMIAEASELKAWLPWKDWKQDYGRELTEEEFWGVVEELVDILHFWLEACLVAGLDAEEVAGFYLAKNLENRARQERGY